MIKNIPLVIVTEIKMSEYLYHYLKDEYFHLDYGIVYYYPAWQKHNNMLPEAKQILNSYLETNGIDLKNILTRVILHFDESWD